MTIQGLKPSPFSSAMQLRRTFGDFGAITNRAKYFARLGQCFSATVTSPDLRVARGQVRV